MGLIWTVSQLTILTCYMGLFLLSSIESWWTLTPAFDMYWITAITVRRIIWKVWNYTYMNVCVVWLLSYDMCFRWMNVIIFQCVCCVFAWSPSMNDMNKWCEWCEFWNCVCASAVYVCMRCMIAVVCPWMCCVSEWVGESDWMCLDSIIPKTPIFVYTSSGYALWSIGRYCACVGMLTEVYCLWWFSSVPVCWTDMLYIW